MLTAPARRILALRQVAAEIGDAGLFRECDWQLARWGISPDQVTTDTTTPEAREAPRVTRARSATKRAT